MQSAKGATSGIEKDYIPATVLISPIILSAKASASSWLFHSV
jgi:hypothetical protein